jgi:hypothetical protein
VGRVDRSQQARVFPQSSWETFVGHVEDGRGSALHSVVTPIVRPVVEAVGRSTPRSSTSPIQVRRRSCGVGAFLEEARRELWGTSRLPELTRAVTGRQACWKEREGNGLLGDLVIGLLGALIGGFLSRWNLTPVASSLGSWWA